MSGQTIITISRQFGSGGKEIAEKLAKELNIPFYDRELIELAAKESGTNEDLFEDEEFCSSRGYYLLGAIGFTLGSSITSISEMSINDRLFAVQSETIEHIAEQGSCIIVGRCADYVLRNRTDTLSVFIHADIRTRKERAIHVYAMDERNIESGIRKIDKRRANYYEYYTDRKWGEAAYYDLVLDSGIFGIDGCVALIQAALQEKDSYLNK